MSAERPFVMGKLVSVVFNRSSDDLINCREAILPQKSMLGELPIRPTVAIR